MIDTVTQSETQYDCHGFNDDLPKGKSSGSLTIHSSGLTFKIKEHTVRLPFNQLEIKAGGASDRLVFFKHPSYPDWNFYTADRSVLKDPHLASNDSIVPLITKARTKRMTGWATFAAIAAVIILIPALFIFRMDIFTKQIAEQVPAEWEEQLGESVIAQYKVQNDFMGEEEAAPLLEPLITPLLDALDDTRYSYKFYIVNNSTLNAFALPGGEIVIHSALILKADSAEELLGVMGHEVIHVEEQHGIRNVIGAAGIYTIASLVFGDVSGVLAILSGAAPMLLNQSYSRRFETESDVKGYALLQKANIDPSGLSRFFEKLIAEEEKQMENIEDEDTREFVKDAMKFLSTHPASDARVEKLQELSANSDPNRTYRDFSKEFKVLQEAVKIYVTENEEAPEGNEDNIKEDIQ